MPFKSREKHLEYMRAWYLKNRDAQLAYGKNYQSKNKKKLKLYTRKYREERPWLVSYMSAEQRCNNKNNHNYKRYGGCGILFKLTKTEVAQLWERDKARLMKWPTIDRINNDGNYEFGNCRFIEMSENARRPKRKRHAYLISSR